MTLILCNSNVVLPSIINIWKLIEILLKTYYFLQDDGSVYSSQLLVKLIRQKRETFTEAQIREVFDALDLNGDGNITEGEIHEVFPNPGDCDPALASLLMDADVNNDGKITFEGKKRVV